MPSLVIFLNGKAAFAGTNGIISLTGKYTMRHLIILLTLILLIWLSITANAYTAKAPLMKDETAAQAFLANAMKGGRCFAVDIMKGTEGVVVKGGSEGVLPAGRYRLHVPLAMAPLGDLNVSFVEIALVAGESRRTITMLHFPQADEFTDFTLDFTAPGGTVVPYAVTWSLASEEAKKNRVKALNPDIDPEHHDDIGEGIDSEAPKEAADGTISRGDLPKVKYHLAAGSIFIEPLCPLQISDLTTDKITYRPNEPVMASATLHNRGTEAVKAMLTVELISGLETKAATVTETVELPAGASTNWSHQFAVKDLHWGVELCATAKVGNSTTSAGAVFGVTDNFWETALVDGVMYTDAFIDPQAAETRARQMRKNGFTVFESGFWAPDDFGDFTPDSEIFFGGQATYRGSITGTKNIIAAAHRLGIASSVYSNLWGGDGTPSFAMMRKHPDWFAGASFCSDWLEQWPLMEGKKIQPSNLWPLTVLNREHSQPALKLHADELIASHKQFGWDGVRYDSYGSDEWTKMATATVRKLVEQEVPTYRWGYNTSIPTDEKVKALDIMVGGGGLTMEEALRATGAHPASLSAYFNTILTYRDIVWPHGGHLGVCYDKPRVKNGGSLLDDLYLSTFLVAGGAHPYYSQLENRVVQYPRFALRYAEFLYDNRLRPLADPAAVLKLPDGVKLMEWQRLARTRDIGDGRHRLILHLILPPVDDLSLHNPAMQCRPPLRALPLTVTLPAGATVTGVWDLCAIPDATETPLAHHLTGTALSFSVPEVRFWNVIVIEYK